MNKSKLSNESTDFATKAMEVVRLISEAKMQFEMNDHSRLPQPVHYRILWLGFTHVTYNELNFQMNDFDRDYLRSVVVNFKNVVENYSDHNIEIEIDLFFNDTATPLTIIQKEKWLFLSSETIQDTINQYDKKKKYDTVLTTVQTKGKENEKRNKNNPLFGKIDVILGLKTHGIEHHFGYSTFNLFEPVKGTFPLKNLSVPSLYATAVAIHEWLHQLEFIGELLEIEFPPTHGFEGEPNFPGYQEVIRDKNNYDFLEYYESVIRGTCLFTSKKGGYVKQVGMYPKMWRLISRGALDVGVYTIQSVIDNYYLAGQINSRKLTRSKTAFNWIFRYDGDSSFNLIPQDSPFLRIDLDNGWDVDGTTVKLYVKTYSNYRNAQRWILFKNSDGTFCIRTKYQSHRAISFDSKNGQAIIKFEREPIDSQKWIIKNSNSEVNCISDIQAINIVNQNLVENASKIKINGNDAYQVSLNFGSVSNAASFAVSIDGNQIFFRNPKNGEFEKI